MVVRTPPSQTLHMCNMVAFPHINVYGVKRISHAEYVCDSIGFLKWRKQKYKYRYENKGKRGEGEKGLILSINIRTVENI